MNEPAITVNTLARSEPWEWPREAGAVLLAALSDRTRDERERVLAADLAGEVAVMDEQLAAALLRIVRSSDEPEKVRAKAAIAFGATLELCDTDGFEDPDSVPVGERTFQQIRQALDGVYREGSVPKEVRRRILEASVRAPSDWHADAIRAAYDSGDQEWKLTAVFCMRFVPGFDKEILASLQSQDPEIHLEAVRAAGALELEAAWDHVVGLVQGRKTEKSLLLAAILAVGAIRPDEALEILDPLADSDDEQIADAVLEATSLSGLGLDEDADETNEASDEDE